MNPSIKVGDTFDLFPVMKKAVREIDGIDKVTNETLDKIVAEGMNRFSLQTYLKKKAKTPVFFKEPTGEGVLAAEVDVEISQSSGDTGIVSPE